jgi:hypothetical protein
MTKPKNQIAPKPRVSWTISSEVLEALRKESSKRKMYISPLVEEILRKGLEK